jgi:pimeloyl-ACP methyl ester carboxylesterase
VTAAIEPFTIGVDEGALDDLRDRLARTRYTDQIPGTGWDYGVPTEYLRDLAGYWRDGYDWRKEEAKLNELPQFRTEIDGQSIHFIHARSPRTDATPLLLTHGWPGTIVEFVAAIPLLTDTFHVVAPSLPGYGFSDVTRTPGWDVPRIVRAFAELMARLGYDRYVAQGGDWGAQVTTRLGALDPEHCMAIHVNMPIGRAPKEPISLTDTEQSDLADLQRFTREESGYANEQSTKPQTLGAALNDSPAGLLAWIVEKFRTWSDCNGDVESVFTRDQLLTNVTVYWLTQTITSSARLYWEHMHSGDRATYVDVPTGVARYPKEILRYPRAWVQRQYNVTYWNDLPRGGHFAAMEQPDLFAADLRAFAATLG